MKWQMSMVKKILLRKAENHKAEFSKGWIRKAEFSKGWIRKAEISKGRIIQKDEKLIRPKNS